ncbi:universal stress protein [Natrarchaeobius halalkaliphilus]|uniref:Universal stress protein n=1 Tax=Natrarchaeobius halalkaliphilus TaxID=1679091 RepID=A0A3N6LM59_9EURY|nr:universal stress protein [Natrarchaeobius halalkaliphilus]RQG90163.1 universal stress protein [Natrarchaeobius halalkaliphilus]
MAILVAYDGSEPAQEAVEHAVRNYPGEEIVLLRVVEAAGGSTGAGMNLAREFLKERRTEISESIDEDVAEIAADDDVEFRTETAVGDPARAIVSFAEDHDIDHIVVGNHGRSGVSRVLLGSVAEGIVRRAPAPVTVVR